MAVNTLQQIWGTTKRMEICKTIDKTSIKFLQVLIEFRQLWSLKEFESEQKTVALAASFQCFKNSNNQISGGSQSLKDYDTSENKFN